MNWALRRSPMRSVRVSTNHRKLSPRDVRLGNRDPISDFNSSTTLALERGNRLQPCLKEGDSPHGVLGLEDSMSMHRSCETH